MTYLVPLCCSHVQHCMGMTLMYFEAGPLSHKQPPAFPQHPFLNGCPSNIRGCTCSKWMTVSGEAAPAAALFQVGMAAGLQALTAPESDPRKAQESRRLTGGHSTQVWCVMLSFPGVSATTIYHLPSRPTAGARGYWMSTTEE